MWCAIVGFGVGANDGFDFDALVGGGVGAVGVGSGLGSGCNVGADVVPLCVLFTITTRVIGLLVDVCMGVVI